jgi:hypothetical protein
LQQRDSADGVFVQQPHVSLRFLEPFVEPRQDIFMKRARAAVNPRGFPRAWSGILPAVHPSHAVSFAVARRMDGLAFALYRSGV